MLPRAALAVLLCIAGVRVGRADGNAGWLLVAFETVCLAKPNSIAELDALATGRGFARKPFDDSRPLPVKPEEEFNWLSFWRLGEGRARLELTGITGGNAERHTLSCLMNASDVVPDEIIAGVKRWPGFEGPRMEREKEDKATLTWTLAGDPRQGRVLLLYDPRRGPRMVGLDYEQVFTKAAVK